ncbi:hypothetical protein M011DRAFT_180657 [Sporormia fimetaria CBS 119925]|uniref:C2H2-type domain-containing protein n=1 Tax=Sporormia fimetaria CBS 119925 TaxID=1340428 RepID=A0A6A6VNH0_9PLEO|nr:hypothetical protein M011DRAFT_180657 [Sporormia fimetaria CBS 119925]
MEEHNEPEDCAAQVHPGPHPSAIRDVSVAETHSAETGVRFSDASFPEPDLIMEEDPNGSGKSTHISFRRTKMVWKSTINSTVSMMLNLKTGSRMKMMPVRRKMMPTKRKIIPTKKKITLRIGDLWKKMQSLDPPTHSLIRRGRPTLAHTVENDSMMVPIFDDTNVRTFASVAAFRRHWAVQHGEKRYTCLIKGCGQKFTALDLRATHERCHFDRTAFTCQVDGCRLSFSTFRALSSHLCKNSSKKYECPHPGCGRLFTELDTLDRHVKTHTGERFPCPEEGCRRTYMSRRSLWAHRRTHTHPNEKYTCPREGCGASYGSSRALRVHMNSQGHSVQTYTGSSLQVIPAHLDTEARHATTTCPWEDCGHTESSLQALKAHLDAHTQFYGWTTCPVAGCGRIFFTRGALRYHIGSHLGNRHACPEEGCAHTCTTPAGIQKHLEDFHRKGRYNCPEDGCAHTVFTEEGLRTHMKVHESGRHMCLREGCGRSFASKQGLLFHMRAHTGGGNLITCPKEGSRGTYDFIDSWGHVQLSRGEEITCPKEGCGRTFSFRTDLEEHLRNHTTNEHVCPVQGCGRRYATKKNLDRHIKQFHPE